MYLLPAIDILGGKAVRLAKGDYSRVTVYHDDPAAQAQLFEEQGATWLHVVDLDGARSGTPENIAIIERILKKTLLKVEVGGGVRSLDTIARLADAGVSRVVLGTSLVADPAFAEAAIAQYGKLLCAGIDAKGGEVAVAGWREGAGVAAEELARLAADTSAASGEGADGGNASNTANQSGQSASVTVDGSVNWNVTRDEFISTWTARIDAYLSGSPLAGYGRVFAEAAWDNSVDPRWSPAIACIESTKGTYCFRDYNAWGWMTSTRFSSWEESITAHVAFLGDVYGPTLTPAAAQKYCPPTWQDWYNKVGGQMNLI